MQAPILSGVRLSEAFGPIEVLHQVDVDARSREVQARVGENGAGKSTVMKLQSGPRRLAHHPGERRRLRQPLPSPRPSP